MSLSKLLILGGTSEAAALARALTAQHPGLTVITSLAGATSKPAQDLRGTVQVGGFGGADGLAAFLKEQAIDAVIDATHPFAAQITQNAVDACTAANVARLRLDRPQWPHPQNTDVVFVPDMTEAAHLLVRTGSQAAFLTVGRKSLGAFQGLDKTHLLVRLIEEPQEPLGLDHYTVVTGRPPFDVAHEEALMRTHHIDTLVSKASGGEATHAKLIAAENVRARIILIRRPVPPDGARVMSVKDALAWVRDRV